MTKIIHRTDPSGRRTSELLTASFKPRPGWRYEVETVGVPGRVPLATAAQVAPVPPTPPVQAPPTPPTYAESLRTVAAEHFRYVVIDMERAGWTGVTAESAARAVIAGQWPG